MVCRLHDYVAPADCPECAEELGRNVAPSEAAMKEARRLADTVWTCSGEDMAIEAIARALDAARAQMKEHCAKVADDEYGFTAGRIAAAIRALGDSNAK